MIVYRLGLKFERSFDKIQDVRSAAGGGTMSYTTSTITNRYHDAIVDWQKHNFPEIDILMKHWDHYFKGVPPFQLVSRLTVVASPFPFKCRANRLYAAPRAKLRNSRYSSPKRKSCSPPLTLSW